MRISTAWRKKAETYRTFAKIAEDTGFVCDFSEEAAQAMFVLETYGTGVVRENNGYAIGKKWLDVQLAMWREDLTCGAMPVVTADEISSGLLTRLPKDEAERAQRRAA